MFPHPEIVFRSPPFSYFTGFGHWPDVSCIILSLPLLTSVSHSLFHKKEINPTTWFIFRAEFKGRLANPSGMKDLKFLLLLLSSNEFMHKSHRDTPKELKDGIHRPLVKFKHLKYVTMFIILFCTSLNFHKDVKNHMLLCAILLWYTWITKVCLKTDPFLPLRRHVHTPSFLKRKRIAFELCFCSYYYHISLILFFERAQFRVQTPGLNAIVCPLQLGKASLIDEGALSSWDYTLISNFSKCNISGSH